MITAFNFGSLFFLMFFLIFKKNKENRYGNFWFVVFFLALLGAFLVGSMREFKVYLIYPHLYKLGDLNSFSIAPSLFLAVKYFTTPFSRIKKADWFHFLPTLFYVGLNIRYLLLRPEELASLIQNPAMNRKFFYLLELFFILQCVVYLIFALIKIIRYQKNIKFYEASDRNDLQWLKYFLYGIMLMLLIWILDLSGYLGNFFYLGYSVCIYFLGYFVINQRELFPYNETNKNELITLIQPDNSTNEGKIQIIRKEVLDHEKEKLLATMLNHKVFLDNDLNLVKLAQIQKLSIRELSYVINEGFAENFNQFINKYRVEESKRLLSDADFNHLNMVGIAYQAGFNSKTIFNTAFKKITGQTPTDYRKNSQK